MSFDHGILNVPLSKRGNIDREIDRYKAQQRADARAKAKADAAEMKELRAKAKGLIPAADPEMLARVAANTGTTVAQVRARLKSMSHWQPHLVIRMFGGAA